MIHRFKQIFWRALQHHRRSPAFKPDYAGAFSTFNALSKLSSEEVIDHFRQRQVPVLFHDGHSMKQLVDSVCQDHPEWCLRLRDKVQKDVEVSFFIYGLSRGPLLGDGQWDLGRASPGSDLQYQKKTHRFSFVPAMVLDSVYDPTHASRLFNLLEDWMTFASGSDGQVCFNSNLAVIQRLMATTWAWVFGYALDSGPRHRLDGLLLPIIANDIRFLTERLGDSYANNHLLADYFAAWFIALLFPELTAGDLDVEACEARWVEELIRQTYPDGGSFEQSVHYHEFACEMSIAYLLLSRCNGRNAPDAAVERIKKLLLFQLKLGGVEGIPYYFGDFIEDNFFPLGVNEGLSPAMSREVYRALFDPSEAPASIDLPATECAYWLLGGLTEAQDNSPEQDQSSLVSLPDSGFYLLKTTAATEVLFRTGPAEALDVSAGHAHSDYLSIYLKLNGRPLLVDSGTFTYRSNPDKWSQCEPPWRTYFAGPEAHNVVVKKGFDPLGAYSGDFRPKKTAARVRSLVYANAGGIDWVHGDLLGVSEWSGYARGVIGIQDEYCVVYDSLAPNQKPDWLGLQFAPGIFLDDEENGYRVQFSGGDSLMLYASDDFVDSSLVLGSADPIGGWVSESYGKKEPAPQLRLGFRQDVEISAILFDDAPSKDCSISVERRDQSIWMHIQRDDVQDFLLLCLSESLASNEVENIRVDARVLFVRKHAHQVQVIRLVDVLSLHLPDELAVKFKKRESWAIITTRGGDVDLVTASGHLHDVDLIRL